MKKYLSLFLIFILSAFTYAQDFSKGIFIVNEGWFGHDNGSVNFLDEEGYFSYNIYKTANNDLEKLGATTQFGTIYGDSFFLVSKQDGSGKRLIVADAKTMKKKASISIPSDGRAFVGVDENTGYVSTLNGIYIFNSKDMILGNLIDGTKGGQIGNMVRTSKYVFAIKQNTGLLIIDPNSHSIIKTIANTSFNTLAQSKDGNVWIGAGKNLIKVNPITFETEKIPLTGTTINGTWGAWNAGGFCSSSKNNVLYWTNSGSFGGGSTISKYDIDTQFLNTTFYTIPGQDGTYKQTFYGAGLRIDPKTDNLVITTTESGWGSHYEKNWMHIVNNTGTLLNTYQLSDYYWFPAMPAFPDNYAPEINPSFGNSSYNITEESTIDLKNIATDLDNLDVAIVKTFKEVENEGIINASIDEQDQLVISPLKKGIATLEIAFTSNGKTTKKEIVFNVTSTLGTNEVNSISNFLPLYPNPFSEYFFIDAKQANILTIYSVNGTKVLEQSLKTGKNQINVSHLNQGIYLIKANSQTYKAIKK